MGRSIRKRAGVPEVASVSLGELIHQHVRIAIETAVHEELRAALGARSYERSDVRRGYRNGTKARALTGPSGPVVLTVPRARLFGAIEWTSTILPRYQRRLQAVNEAIVATYLAGGNTRRNRGALRPLLKDAPLSKSAVSRVGEVWPRAAVQRCCVHKLRNLERKAPKHALAEIRDHFHRIVYAVNADAARAAYVTFERTWAKRCPGVVTSLRDGGDELLTFFRFPKTPAQTQGPTNALERLHEEFRRRVKTQGSLPSEDAALTLLFG